MSAFFSGLWTIASIELRQRVRGVAWYVLLGVFFVLVLLVTGVATASLSYQDDTGGALYSVVIYFVLLLASLSAPALSGNAINGDRDAGTLATTQVTLVSTTQLVLGKFVAAWISSLAFLVVAIPFILFTFAQSGVQVSTVVSSLLVLIVLLGVVSAAGVGLSGIMRRPLMSVVVTYLVVALLSIGTLIAFTLGGTAIRSTVVSESYQVDWQKYQDGEEVEFDPDTGLPVGVECTVYDRAEYQTPRFDYVWWTLAANPYVVLADAAPTRYDRFDSPTDLFGLIKLAVRTAQTPPDLETTWNECEPQDHAWGPSAREVIESSIPSWFVGLAINVAIGAGLLIGAVNATRTPARRLASGSRIA